MTGYVLFFPLGGDIPIPDVCHYREAFAILFMTFMMFTGAFDSVVYIMMARYLVGF